TCWTTTGPPSFSASTRKATWRPTTPWRSSTATSRTAWTAHRSTWGRSRTTPAGEGIRDRHRADHGRGPHRLDLPESPWRTGPYRAEPRRPTLAGPGH